MKIYSFWSADTTFFTTSSSLKKAQSIGKENLQQYLDTCDYLEEDPKLNELGKAYFIPSEVESITKLEFKHMLEVDQDILVLDDELYNI
jgi:hypothetical protein